MVVIPARKGTTGSWTPKKEWEKEDKFIPKELNKGIINDLVGSLALIQMGINGDDYSQSYYPFYAKAIMSKAFEQYEKEYGDEVNPEWQWVKKTYNTNDTYLKFSRFRK